MPIVLQMAMVFLLTKKVCEVNSGKRLQNMVILVVRLERDVCYLWENWSDRVVSIIKRSRRSPRHCGTGW